MENKPTIRIDKIVIYHETDTDPDTSWLGEYSHTPGPADKTIDREERGDRGRNEYRYFVAAMSGEETGNAESVEQDYERMKSLNRGDFRFIGIYAFASLSYDIGNNCRRCESMQSAGLWGIESDSDEDYIASVEADELAGLRQHLKTFGVDCGNFDELAKTAEHREK